MLLISLCVFIFLIYRINATLGNLPIRSLQMVVGTTVALFFQSLSLCLTLAIQRSGPGFSSCNSVNFSQKNQTPMYSMRASCIKTNAMYTILINGKEKDSGLSNFVQMKIWKIGQIICRIPSNCHYIFLFNKK